MKKYSLIFAAIFFLSITSSFQAITAQDRTREERLQEEEEKQKIHEEIDQQKQEMIQHKRSEDIQRALENGRQQIDEAVDQVQKSYHEFQRDHRRESPDPPFALTFPGFSFAGVFPGDDAERSSLSLSKSLKESNFDRDYIFDVAPTSKTVSMSITGYCKEGEIRIRIRMPNGKIYSDVLIDESGNLNWRKSFNISEEENMDKTGDWKYEIKTSKATGYFRIALQTY